MAKDKSLEEALVNVPEGRRAFLKGMLVGSAALAALPLITSTVLGQGRKGGKEGKGKGKGKGAGKGKGKGAGKG